MSLAIDETGVSPIKPIDTGGIGGHPRGLTTLFFTEMWERFSFYGMKALLLLYMTKSLAEGGLAFEQKYAALIFGTYASSVYWTPLIGGWLADKIFGARRAVLIGGIIIACGHFSMAFRSMTNFYAGLILIALGTGLLKPNISGMVGELYAEGDKRRDAGFSIFYMGINMGAFFAPIICGYLGQKIDWHYGFAAAGVGMVLGLLQYVFSGDRLRNVGLKPVKKDLPDIAQVKTIEEGVDYVTMILALGGCLIFVFCERRFFGGPAISALFPGVIGFFAGYLSGTVRHLRGEELMRVAVIFILFTFASIFWMSFEQAGSSLTLFADRLTRLTILGWEFPSSWFQLVQPGCIWLLAPVFAFIWMKLGQREPSSPAKFAFGLFFAGTAFALVAFASTLTGHGKLSPFWLIGVYLLQTIGELCLSPVGLSTTTKLSPARMVGLMMGVWFLSISIGDFVGGLSAGLFSEAEGALFRLFGVVALITFVAAILLAVLVPVIKRLTPESS
jgi:POT family proton-dependent oligopeptide transporter